MRCERAEEVAVVQQRPVGEVMTKDVLTVPPDACFKAVVRALQERRVDAAPVVDASGRLLGVVSESDLTCREERPAGWAALLGGRRRRQHARKARARTAADLMSTPARTVTPSTPVCDALRLMTRNDVGRLVVVDDDGQVQGILTRSDLLRAFLREDDEIRRDVLDAVRHAVQGSTERIDVQVQDGVVLLAGWVERTSGLVAAVAAARAVEGVVDVEEDILSDIDDITYSELSARGPFV